MKPDKIKLKWKIFSFILIFSILIIFIFCFFQIIMLEKIYKKNKINSISGLIDKISDVIETNGIDNDEINGTLLDASSTNETAIYVIDMNAVIVNKINDGLYLSQFQNKEVFLNIIDKSKSTNLKKFFITFEGSVAAPLKFGDYPAITDKPLTSIDSAIICAKFLTLNNQKYLLVLDGRLAPVAPAVTTLKQQLFYISLIILVLSIVVALIISSVISKPIKKMTDSAMLLANGSRNITFDGKGYEEITKLNQALNYAVEELNKTDTLQKEILANISHDLKTPLTLISGYAQMMLDIKDEISDENLQVIVDEANRLNMLVNDLVKLSKLQAKTELFKLETYNLTSSIKQIVLRQQKLYEHENIIINFHADKDIFIRADEQKIIQVMYNFIGNAIIHSKSNCVDIFQEVRDDKVIISVKDYGDGIKESDLTSIWNRYTRLDREHTRLVEGTGLGLSIVKEILERHNFKYGVISKVGVGSTFYFEAPIERR